MFIRYSPYPARRDLTPRRFHGKTAPPDTNLD
jgi:hypothetical protein